MKCMQLCVNVVQLHFFKFVIDVPSIRQLICHFVEPMVALVAGNKIKHNKMPFVSCIKINLTDGSTVGSRNVFIVAHGTVWGQIILLFY